MLQAQPPPPGLLTCRPSKAEEEWNRSLGGRRNLVQGSRWDMHTLDSASCAIQSPVKDTALTF